MEKLARNHSGAQWNGKGTTVMVNGKRRVGRIAFSINQVYSHYSNISETLRLLGFVPLRVESRMDVEIIEMVGLSLYFDLVDKGAVLPFYEFRVRDLPDGEQELDLVKKT